YRGLMSYLQGTEHWSWIVNAIRKQEQQYGTLSKEERGALVNDLLRGLGGDSRIGLNRPDNTKERVMNLITPEIYRKYYHDTRVSAYQYMTKMNQHLAWRELFAKTDPALKARLKRMKALRKMIADLEGKINTYDETVLSDSAQADVTRAQLQRWIKNLDAAKNEVYKLSNETSATMTNSIGSWVSQMAIN